MQSFLVFETVHANNARTQRGEANSSISGKAAEGSPEQWYMLLAEVTFQLLQCLCKTFEISSCPWSSRLNHLCLADTLRRRAQASVGAQWVAFVSLFANAMLTLFVLQIR